MHEAMVEQKKPAVSILRRLQSFSVIRCTSIVHIGEMILCLIQVQPIMSHQTSRHLSWITMPFGVCVDLQSSTLFNGRRRLGQWLPDARRLLEQRLGQARWKSDVTSDMRFGLAAIWSVDTENNRIGCWFAKRCQSCCVGIIAAATRESAPAVGRTTAAARSRTLNRFVSQQSATLKVFLQTR